MNKLITIVLILYTLTASYALMVLAPIVYNKKDMEISENCNTQLNQYNTMVNDVCKDDEKCQNVFTESFVENVRNNCNGNDMEKKLFEQIESTYLFNSISQLEVDGVNCSIYSVNLGQSIESRCACMKKVIEYLEDYTTQHENSILTESITDFKLEISEYC
ncbi:hypothetical protein BCR32DRAFT_329331 [Anaeromyces robustus]|uniref:Uncharacterized protein n=1 Tax=Anaeromyces robustus TaxID=1754192 RepID=A0A1Y1WSH6_9FUNG|nr:hypothetical protein BCR32DRAFT_329331 [Anaeromyces robustus]|eukprot:ORX76489.1 hypothetical protein BCR32DRAFT_329331 [Anaeromyces robustus]